MLWAEVASLVVLLAGFTYVTVERRVKLGLIALSSSMILSGLIELPIEPSTGFLEVLVGCLLLPAYGYAVKEVPPLEEKVPLPLRVGVVLVALVAGLLMPRLTGLFPLLRVTPLVTLGLACICSSRHVLKLVYGLNMLARPYILSLAFKLASPVLIVALGFMEVFVALAISALAVMSWRSLGHVDVWRMARLRW